MEPGPDEVAVPLSGDDTAAISTCQKAQSSVEADFGRQLCSDTSVMVHMP